MNTKAIVKGNKGIEDFMGELLSAPGTLDPWTYQYFKGLEDRTIILSGSVGEDILETVMLPLMEMCNDGSGEPITIVLSTNGGSLFAAMSLCDMIDVTETPIDIIIPNYAYSMGSIIAMAGYNNPKVTKKCFRHSTGLIHAGSSYFEGNSFSVKDTFHFQERFEQKVEDYVLSHSKITSAAYKEMERYERWLTSEDMLELGIVDEIIGDTWTAEEKGGDD